MGCRVRDNLSILAQPRRLVKRRFWGPEARVFGEEKPSPFSESLLQPSCCICLVRGEMGVFSTTPTSYHNEGPLSSPVLLMMSAGLVELKPIPSRRRQSIDRRTEFVKSKAASAGYTPR